MGDKLRAGLIERGDLGIIVILLPTMNSSAATLTAARRGRSAPAPSSGRALVLSALIVALTGPVRAEPETTENALVFGTFDWYPYQYETQRDREQSLTGLDIELVGKIARHAGREVVFEQRSWPAILQGLRDGSIDVTVGFTSPD